MRKDELEFRSLEDNNEAGSPSAAKALTGSKGAVYGSVRMWLRAEGFSVFALSAVLYWRSGRSWWIFLVFLLTPDLAMLSYLINPKIGAFCYNVVHSYFLPLSLATVAVALGGPGIISYVCIWMAHIGMDRCLGYGLKYPTAFGRTHLGALANGPGAPIEAAADRL